MRSKIAQEILKLEVHVQTRNSFDSYVKNCLLMLSHLKKLNRKMCQNFLDNYLTVEWPGNITLG